MVERKYLCTVKLSDKEKEMLKFLTGLEEKSISVVIREALRKKYILTRNAAIAEKERNFE